MAASTANTIESSKSKYVHPQTKCIVYGYIRQMQELLPSYEDNPYYTIPELVTIICLSFYNLGEYFEIVCDVLKVSNNNRRLYSNQFIYSNGYGSNIISLSDSMHNYKYEWKFNILQIYHVAIGITTDFLVNKDTKYYQSESKGFNFAHEFDGYQQSWNDGQIRLGDQYCYGKGDVMVLIFDTKNRRLTSYKENEERCKSIFTDIPDGDYRMAVCVYGHGDDDSAEIELIDFIVIDQRSE